MFERHDVEDFVLILADIVMENRALRERIMKLEQREQKYRQDVNRANAATDEFHREFLKAILENTLSPQR